MTKKQKVKFVAETQRQKVKFVTEELAHANANGKAPYGRGASVAWMRTCSMKFLECIQDLDDNDSFAAATLTAITLLCWERMTGTLTFHEDEFEKHARSIITAASAHLMERLGLISIKYIGSESVFSGGDIQIHVHDSALRLGEEMGFIPPGSCAEMGVKK